MSHEDRHTSTVSAAAGFERNRSGGADARSDALPSPSDLGADAREDAYYRRMEARREAEAIARGEYVPDGHGKAVGACLAMLLAQHGVFTDLTPAREGVWSLTVPHDPADVAAALGDRADVAATGGTVWVRVAPAYATQIP